MKRSQAWAALTVSLLSHACEQSAENSAARPAPAPQAGQGGETGEAGEPTSGTAAQGGLSAQAGERSLAGGESSAGGEAEAVAGSPHGGVASGGDGAMAGAGASIELVCHDGSRGEGATCDSYCQDWFPICVDNPTTATVFADVADCLAQCAAFTEEQLCCRGYHVANAPDKPTSHCPHAAGIRTCP